MDEHRELRALIGHLQARLEKAREDLAACEHWEKHYNETAGEHRRTVEELEDLLRGVREMSWDLTVGL